MLKIEGDGELGGVILRGAGGESVCVLNEGGGGIVYVN